MDIDYNAESRMFSLMDSDEGVMIVMTQEQLEALLDYYCKIFDRLLM